MPESQPFIDLLGRDPILAYSLLAAFLLAVVSLVSGLARLDFLVLGRPRVILHVSFAVLLAFFLTLLATSIQADAQPLGASVEPWSPPWFLAGARRFPLYLIALAYGPSVGLVAAGLFAAFEANTLLPSFREAILALELVVLGWLAIFPSPRDARWAGPLNALLAYGLAWGTAGVALLEFQTGEVSLGGILAQHRPALGGLALTAFLLLLVGPVIYRELFRHSRIAPVGRGVGLSDVVEVREVDPTFTREFTHLSQVDLPAPTSTKRRARRTLDPPPEFDD